MGWSCLSNVGACFGVQAPLLEILKLNNNSLTGTLPVSWTLLPWLTSIDVSFNRLSGNLPWEVSMQEQPYVVLHGC